MPTELRYRPDSLLLSLKSPSVAYNPTLNIFWFYNHEDQVNQLNYYMIEDGKSHIINSKTGHFANGSLRSFFQSEKKYGYDKDNKLKMTINYTRNTLGRLATEHTVYDVNDGKETVTDNLQYEDVYFNDIFVHKVSGHRKKDGGGWGNVTAAIEFRDPNGHVQAVIGADTQNKDIPHQKSFSGNMHLSMSPDGRALSKTYIEAEVNTDSFPFGFFGDEKVWFRLNDFYMADGSVMGTSKGELYTDLSKAGVELAMLVHGDTDLGGLRYQILRAERSDKRHLVLNTPSSTEQSVIKSTFFGTHFTQRDIIDLVSRTYPASTSIMHTANGAESLQTIAERYYGIWQADSWLEQANMGLWRNGPVQPGQQIRLAQFINAYESAGDHEPYRILMGHLVGALYPHLIAKKPHESFFAFIFKILFIGAIGILAPYLAGLLVPVMGITFALVEVAISAVLDLVEQGIMIGLGIQKHFSVGELISVAMMPGKVPGFNLENLALFMLESGIADIEKQLLEMAVGERHHFNLAEVGYSTLTAGADMVLSHELVHVEKIKYIGHYVTDLTDDLVNAEIGKIIMDENFSVARVAEEALGQAVVQGVDDEVKEHLLHQLAVVNKQLEHTTNMSTRAFLQDEATHIKHELSALGVNFSAAKSKKAPLRNMHRAKFSHQELYKQTRQTQQTQRIKAQYPTVHSVVHHPEPKRLATVSATTKHLPTKTTLNIETYRQWRAKVSHPASLVHRIHEELDVMGNKELKIFSSIGPSLKHMFEHPLESSLTRLENTGRSLNSELHSLVWLLSAGHLGNSQLILNNLAREVNAFDGIGPSHGASLNREFNLFVILTASSMAGGEFLSEEEVTTPSWFGNGRTVMTKAAQPVSRLGIDSRFSGGLFGKVDDNILGLESPEKVGSEAGYSVGLFQGAGQRGAEGRLPKAKLLESPRKQLMRVVEHPGLEKLVRVHYRENAKVASGSTADALRHELKTGEMLSPSGHMQKVLEGRAKLTKLIKSGKLYQNDLDIAKWIRQDLINALSEERVHSYTMKNSGM